ncbi:hypothetical protein [Sphingomonas aracearum]|uniref:DUF4398 domain-containing protein n=1 Tax=Sphingomonas aracearum TaxID=2283317 RepID=A0A369VS42_9SPHN|nr:hypothetical protein [Sphingomonas aracearum]RDE05204.1 hypothetical protein DVW87_07990 [Sphingomonas aracearum]
MSTRLLSASPALLGALGLLLGGCAAGAGGGDAPSLLPRAIESRGDALPAYTPPPLVADPELDAAIARNADARAAAARRLEPIAQRAQAAAAAARGAAVGSERWIAAQSALAELDDLRASASAAVTDLEQLAIARAAQGLPDYPALEQARQAAAAELAAQTQRIERLEATVPRA